MDVFAFMVDVKANYGHCEAIIFKDGSIDYAPRGHVNKMIEFSGYTDTEIYDMMPVTASPIHWLPEFTGMVPIWENFISYQHMA